MAASRILQTLAAMSGPGTLLAVQAAGHVAHRKFLAFLWGYMRNRRCYDPDEWAVF